MGRPKGWWLLALAAWGCGGEPFPGDPLARARTVPAGEASALLKDSRLPSAARGRVTLILASRFGAAALPWLEELLAQLPLERWPDRFHAALALRVIPGDRARSLLLACLADGTDESLRAAAVQALEPRYGEPSVAAALARTARVDPSRWVRREAAQVLARHPASQPGVGAGEAPR